MTPRDSTFSKDLFNNLKEVKLLAIEEEVANNLKDSYLKYGNGKTKGIKDENVKVYKAKYIIKYENDNIGPQTSGEDIDYFWVIREKENGEWLIDAIGQ